jgi:hypothetical protein
VTARTVAASVYLDAAGSALLGAEHPSGLDNEYAGMPADRRDRFRLALALNEACRWLITDDDDQPGPSAEETQHEHRMAMAAFSLTNPYSDRARLLRELLALVPTEHLDQVLAERQVPA